MLINVFVEIGSLMRLGIHRGRVNSKLGLQFIFVFVDNRVEAVYLCHLLLKLIS